MFPDSSSTATFETQASTIAFKKLSDSFGLANSPDFAVSLVRIEIIEGDKLSATTFDRHVGRAESILVWDLINILFVRYLAGFTFFPTPTCGLVVIHLGVYRHFQNAQTLIAPE
jgi:hypothetical protein